MLELKSTVTVESREHPGVSFVVKVLSNIERVERDVLTFDTRAEYSDRLQEIEIAKDAEQPTARASELAGHALTRTMRAVIDYQLVSVSGVTVDGADATIHDVLRLAPDTLIAEMYVACQRAAGMMEPEQKNSSSPGTSTEAGQPGETSTTA